MGVGRFIFSHFCADRTPQQIRETHALARRIFDERFRPLAVTGSVAGDAPQPDDSTWPARFAVRFDGDSRRILDLWTQVCSLQGPTDLVLEGESAPAVRAPSDYGRGEAEPMVFRPPVGNQVFIRVTDSDGRPVARSLIELRERSRTSGMRRERYALTGEDGAAGFERDVDYDALTVVARAAGFYGFTGSMLVFADTTLRLRSVPQKGPLGWWHRTCGVSAYEATRGQGIVIGIADTGCAGHDALRHVRPAGRYENGAHDPAGGGEVDAAFHGTLIAGTIGARPTEARWYAGIAPGADLLAACISRPNAYGVVTVAPEPIDLMNAIDGFAKRRVHLINISQDLGAPSVLVEDALARARTAGALCFCGTGNNGKSGIVWPAQYRVTMAVGSVGEGVSTTAARSDLGRNLYIAHTSNYGFGIDCVAPGEDILTTQPGGAFPYAPVAGTSFATAVATGVAACLLARNAHYGNLPADHRRADEARRMVESAVQQLQGISPDYQGGGLVRL